jgi:cytidylate kinase
MSSSSEKDVVVAYMYLQRRRQKKRRCWVHPYNVRNNKHSSAVVSRELSQQEEKFHEFYRISPDSFQFLETVVSAQLQNQDTNFRLTISPTEKLLITIR